MTVETGGIVDALPGLVWTTAGDGAGDFFNRRWRDYSGLTAEEARGRGWRSAIHPEDLDSVLDAFAANRPSEIAAEIEGRLRRSDGEYRWFAFRLSRLPKHMGGQDRWCWLGVEADETRTGPDHPGLDGRLRRLLDTLPAQILSMTPSMEVEFVNREVREFYGRSLDELSQWDSSGDIHPDDLPATFERVERLLKTGETWDFQNRMRRADGVYRWVRSRMVPSRDAQGNIVRYCSIQTDVDDLKRAEDLLAGEIRLLEMVALGGRLPDVLDAVCRFVEGFFPECFCCVYPIDWSGPVFKYGVAPSLPASFVDPIKGWPVDVDNAPCGVAIAEDRQVIIADVATDPAWRGTKYRDHVVSHGLRSAWSTLIRSLDGRILGSFCIYQNEPGTPTPGHQELISRVTQIASIALDRAEADEALAAREADLRRAHAQLSEGQRLSKTGSFTADLQLDQHQWSEEYFRIFEIDPATPPSVQVVRDRVHPDDLPLFDTAIQRGIDGAGSDFIFRILTPKAGVKHLRGAARVIEHIAGRPILMGTVQDITESKVTEQELRRSQAHLMEGQRLTKAGSFFWLMDTGEPEFSDELVRIFGFEDGTPVTLDRVYDRMHPDDRSLAAEKIEAVRKGHEADYVLRLRMPDGSTKYLRSFSRGGRIQNGRLELFGSVLDITESKLAEAALRAQEAELRQAYDYLTEAQRLSKTGSFTWDVFADEHNWSDEIRRIFGFGPDVQVTMGMIQAAVHPDDMSDVERVIGGAPEGRDFDLVFRILTTDGEVRYAHVVGHRIAHITDRPVFLGALQDVTEAKVAETALRAGEAELRRTNRYLTAAQQLSRTGSFTWDVLAEDSIWSDEMYRIFDVADASGRGMNTVRQAIHPEDAPILDALGRRLGEASDFDIEFRIITASGLKHVHIVAHRVEEIPNRPVFVGAAQDITDRKLVEEELRQSEAYLVEAQRLSKTGSFTWDVVAKDSVWSDEMYRIFDVPAAEVPGMSVVRRAIHPDDAPVFDDMLQRLGEVSDFDVEFRIHTPSGLKHVHIVAHRVDQTRDRPVFVGACEDITDYKLAEQALKASEAELRRTNGYLTIAQRLSKTGSWISDFANSNRQFSEEMYRICEVEPGSTDLSPLIPELTHPDDRPIIQTCIQLARSGQDCDAEFRLITPSGITKSMHVMGHSIESVDGPIYVAAAQDITDRKLAEQALKASEAELRRTNSYLTVAETLSKTGSYIWDPGKNERHWSEEMYRIFDLDPETAIPSAMTERLIHPEDRPIIAAQTQATREGRDYDDEFRLVMPSGTVKTVHCMGRLIGRTEDGPIYVGATQDITDRRLAEERLDRARRELAQVSRITTLSALTASIAHEVNQPLAGIIANASTCLRLLAADPPNTEGAEATAQRTIRDANRAAEVIKRLRALFARRAPASEPFDLDDAASEVLTLASSELEGARVVLHTELSGDLPTIAGDRVQLQQVILNLVLNAADAMRTVDDRARDLTISTARDEGGQIRLSVRDAGVGAKPEQLVRLFDAFYTTKPEGMGVGLAISRSIVEAHGGRIWADANDGPGLTLSVSIPVTTSLSAGAEDGDDTAPDGAGAELDSRKAR